MSDLIAGTQKLRSASSTHIINGPKTGPTNSPSCSRIGWWVEPQTLAHLNRKRKAGLRLSVAEEVQTDTNSTWLTQERTPQLHATHPSWISHHLSYQSMRCIFAANCERAGSRVPNIGLILCSNTGTTNNSCSQLHCGLAFWPMLHRMQRRVSARHQGTATPASYWGMLGMLQVAAGCIK